MKKSLLIVLTLVMSLALVFTFAACGGGGTPAAESDSAADAAPEEAQATIEPGPIVETMTYEELKTALEAFGLDRDSTTYEDVAEYLGYYGQVDEDWTDDKFAVNWYASDDGFATLFFLKETGFYNSWSASGIGRP